MSSFPSFLDGHIGYVSGHIETLGLGHKLPSFLDIETRREKRRKSAKRVNSRKKEGFFSPFFHEMKSPRYSFSICKFEFEFEFEIE